MSGPHSAMRENVTDSLKATPVAGMLTAWVNGWSISDIAAALGIVYTLILLAEKLYRLGVFAWVVRRAIGVTAPKGDL